LLTLQRQVWDVHMDDTLQDYIVSLAAATRAHPDLALGISPRGSLALYKAAQALAAIRDREHVLPDDIKYLAQVTLAHRLIVKPEAELRGSGATAILDSVLRDTMLDLGSVNTTPNPPSKAH
jgi:MoxR-like ATPase